MSCLVVCIVVHILRISMVKINICTVTNYTLIIFTRSKPFNIQFTRYIAIQMHYLTLNQSLSSLVIIGARKRYNVPQSYEQSNNENAVNHAQHLWPHSVAWYTMHNSPTFCSFIVAQDAYIKIHSYTAHMIRNVCFHSIAPANTMINPFSNMLIFNQISKENKPDNHHNNYHDHIVASESLWCDQLITIICHRLLYCHNVAHKTTV